MQVRDSKCPVLAAGLLQVREPSSSRNTGPLLSVRQVAGRLHVSLPVVYRLVELREIPAVRVLNSIRIAEDDLDAFVERVRTS